MPKAVILGLSGPDLTETERAFFAEADPLGFILFARNCETPDQIGALTRALRDAVGREDAPVLIDQEGGRVARLKPPHWRAAPPAAAFGRLADVNIPAAEEAARLNARLIGAELHDLGITVDCAPVLDMPHPDADPIIGDRAFGDLPGIVTLLGMAFCEGLLASGVLPVIKHIPGHGRASVDSHKSLPRVDAPRAALQLGDFWPFRMLARHPGPRPWAMTAHVVFEAWDRDNPATLSPRLIGDIIRGQTEIGFDGIVISDDISMGALSGPIGDNARAAQEAGCDLVLHCNGDMDEMTAVACAVSDIGPDTEARLKASLGAVPAFTPFDREDAQDCMERLLTQTRERTR